MIKLLKLFIVNKITILKRRVFWLYKLSVSNFGNSMTIDFPVIREGAGSLTLGDHSYLGRLSNLGIGKGAKLRALNNTHIATKSTILIKNSCKFEIGTNFKLGEGSRLYVQSNWDFGNHVKIETHCSIFPREPNASGKLIIGHGCHIGDYTIIDLVNDVTMGDNVAVGPNCTLYTHDHEYGNMDFAAWKGGIVSKPIKIEDGAWIGSGVTILPGVIIGRRAIIAAGSVVTKNIPSGTLWGGIPARLIKTI